MVKENGSPRWAVLLFVLAGVAVDLVTLAWIWGETNLSSPTVRDTIVALAGAVVSAVLISIGVALGIRRTHGW